MKHIFVALLLLPALAALAQDTPDQNLNLSDLPKLNFAVPDLPAFKSLGTEPSNLLRPSTPENFYAVASEFFNGKNFILPQAFAVEFSPLLLTSLDKITLQRYRDHRAWNSSRFSLGTFRDEELNTTRAAIGYRISFINEGDVKTDTSITRKIAERLQARSEIRADLMDEYLIRNNLTEEACYNDPACRAAQQQYVDDHIPLKKEALSMEFDTMIDNYVKDHWNARKWDLAVAFTGQSGDALIRNIRYSSFSAWTTYALPTFKQSGQLLVGLHWQNYRSLDDTLQNNISLNLRHYYGANRLKFFVEGQYQYLQETEASTALANFGGELNIRGGLWIDFHAGLQKDFSNNRSSFVSQFSFRYTIPKNFKMF